MTNRSHQLQSPTGRPDMTLSDEIREIAARARSAADVLSAVDTRAKNAWLYLSLGTNLGILILSKSCHERTDNHRVNGRQGSTRQVQL